MLVTIPDLLDPVALDAVCSVLRQSRFVDGKFSAGKHARVSKRNEELDCGSDNYTALNDVVMTRLVQHPLYLQTALPAKICAPIYARYTEGMEYAGHLDDPIMGEAGARYRSDISVSVFLNAPDEYDGGELCIQNAEGSIDYKLAAGQALLYPSTHFHAVKPIIRGERLVAITWVQSMIRRADQREILVQLDRARESLEHHPAPRQNVELAYANLFRLWAEI